VNDRRDSRNRVFFGLGTVGRDMYYSMESMFLIYFFTDVLNLDNRTMVGMTLVLTVMRIFDALNDPLMGVIVDNTRSKFGKFKPGMLIGGVTGGILLILMFTDWKISGALYIALFAVCYLAWDISYGLNDIAYWSMLPSLTTDQKKREEIGSFARICANIGAFAVVVTVLPLTGKLGEIFGSYKRGWFVMALITTLLMLGFQLFTLFGVRENKGYFREEEKTRLRDMFRVLFKNDQLMWTALAMAVFTIGYSTTVAFGTYYFKYAYGDENMYSVFALVLGVSMLSAMAVFPAVARRMTRRKLYTIATVLIIAGYLLFLFSPMNMLFIGAAGILIFVGEAFVQILMLMFLADTIEYGQLKLGRRNESVTFSVQPFINKMGAALSNGIVGITVVIAGINEAAGASDVTESGIATLKFSMLALPMILIVLAWFLYIRKFRISEEEHARILAELRARGDIGSEPGA